MNTESIRLELSRMTARVEALEDQPLSRIVAAARSEAKAINLRMAESTLQTWARAVHYGIGFRFHLR
ncbi:hypothetical protein [Paenarthrobacter sp. A20]|uniref:hypothetical protein n=1 Tax=Paenarthrobacter sp. A20 TaxID=2817891 RepID=UPI00209ED64A|nr:hypothetical protein [Paenarthrobacter sp. A20]MCP1415460.1 hypothetical protein [Paenarthrobacter sp. A20]